MHIITQIERALKKLYRLEHSYRARDFLFESEEKIFKNKAASSTLEGMVLFSNELSDFQISIVLSKEIQKQLNNYKKWKTPWSSKQLNAFSVAVEELSHFHYLIYRAIQQVEVSLLELELQGDIDRFIITFFALSRGKDAEEVFNGLLKSFFHSFSLHAELTEEQKERYRQANDLSLRFIKSLKPAFLNEDKTELLKAFRELYEKDHHAKIQTCLNR